MSSPAAFVVDLTETNFAEVIGRSRTVPVLVDFWADWCAPCKQMAPVLDKLVKEFAGAFILAKVNADQEPLITQQFGVRGLPTLKLVVQGQIAGELVGAQPEAAIRKLLAPHLTAPPPAGDESDNFHAQVLAAVDAGHVDDALAALAEHLRTKKDDHKTRELQIEILLAHDRLDEAKSLLAESPDVPALKRVRALLGFANRTKELPELSALSVLMQGQPDAQVRYQYALRLVSAARLEEGLDILLDLFRRDRQYGEDLARKTLLEIFDMLGRDDPVAAQYRRRLANYLY